jgi:hypothetical protein
MRGFWFITGAGRSMGVDIVTDAVGEADDLLVVCRQASRS